MNSPSSAQRQIRYHSEYRSVFFAASLATIAAIAACSSGNGIKRDPIVLLGGDLTVFDATALAFDTPNPMIQDNEYFLERFLHGDLLYETPRIAGHGDDPRVLKEFGGLGPLYVGKTCTTCHLGSGRTKSTLFTHGGTGYDFSVFLAFMRTKNGQYLPNYGRVLHDHATFGYQPEGRLTVEYEEVCRTFPTEDKEEYCLITPNYLITDWYTPPFPDRPHLTDEEIMEELEVSVRTPLRHVGMGLMLAVDLDELRDLAATSYPEFDISGKLQQVFEKGQWRVGLSGHKANHFDLTIELGLYSDMGVTNPRYPEEVCEGQSNCTPNKDNDHFQISSQDLADLDMYLQNTGVPARRNVENPQVQHGEQMFYRAKCQLCHTPTLHTRSTPPTLLDGTPLPHLANQTIHPYTDYLVHDMGKELGDDFSQLNATGDEWRTAPLWGLGLQEVVSGHTHFLHDARARNLTEAIMWHGEEGSASRDIFTHMIKEDRDALLSFVRSL